MSRRIKCLINNKLLKKDDSLNILYYGDQDSIKDPNSRHHWFSTVPTNFSCNQLTNQEIEQNQMYQFNLIVCTNPYRYINDAARWGEIFNLPLVLIHDEVPSYVKKENLLQMSFEIDKYNNIVSNKDLIKDLYLYNAKTKQAPTWDDEFNEIFN